jgi:hypothetical protein
VDELPALIVLGEALNEPMAGVGQTTLTVTCLDIVPPQPDAVNW